MSGKQEKRFSERGMVSILITVIMMLVISIIVLGFAQISRREQRQSLDRQLSTQAFLAAESGVNDARKAMQDSLRSTGTVPEKTECERGNPGNDNPYYNYDPILDSNFEVRYTCLLVDASLTNIKQKVSADGSSVVIPIHPETGNVRTLNIRWTAQSDTATNANCVAPNAQLNFPSTVNNGWSCDYGILRMDIVPTDNLNRATLVSEQRTFYLYPTRQTGNAIPTQSYGANAQAVTGSIAPMSCTTARNDCRIDVTNINAASQDYSIRLSAIYRPGNVEITGVNGSNGSIVFTDAQAQVDVTGKAQDVLRRIQVRLSLGQVLSNADYGVQSGGAICKRFSVTENDFRNSNDIQVDDGTNPMCIDSPAPPLPPPPANPVNTTSCVDERDVIFVLDTSGSMTSNWESGTRFQKLVTVTRELAQDINITPAGNHVAIITFSKEAKIVTTLTGSSSQVISAINSLKTEGGTHYLTGLDASSNVLRSAAARAGAQKVMIFISDGKPDDNEGEIFGQANAMKAQNVRIYTIGVTRDGDDSQILRTMAGNGGYYAPAFSEGDLDRIAQSLRPQLTCS